jgi:hypothetical protein
MYYQDTAKFAQGKHYSELDTVITLNQANQTQTPIHHLHTA